MRDGTQVWVVTAVLFASTCLRTTITYLDYPDRSTLATFQWSFVPVWLLVMLVAVWKQWRARTPGDERAARHAALRLAVAGYVPLAFAMGLIDRVVGQLR
jgi:hypothetical protein